MTTTHLLLIGLAVALVAGMLLYNFFQERRFRKQAERMFSNNRGDVLLGDAAPDSALDDGRVEPRIQHDSDEHAEDRSISEHLGGVGGLVQSIDRIPPASPFAVQESAAPASEAAAPADTEPEPAARPPAVPEPLEGAHDNPAIPAQSLPASPLDPAVEYIARLRFVQPVRLSFSRLIDDLRRLGKPVRAYGYRQEGVWEEVGPNPATAYAAIELAVQLADRAGAVSEALLDGFCRLLYQFATEHGGAVSCPERKVALERARELDGFSVGVDVLIGLNIVAREGHYLRGKEIDAIALEAGMRLGADGAYALHDEAGHLLFTLANQEEAPFVTGGVGQSTHGISLLFDLPRVSKGLSVFDRMTELSFNLAERLDARVVDDTGRAVTEDTLLKDRQRLSAYFTRMEAQGIPAGSERALRLFS
jgi:FtsZ-interacting cell division protein ZipA